MSNLHERAAAARATYAAAAALYQQNPTPYAYKRRKKAENALQAAEAALNAAQPAPASPDDPSPAAQELDAAVTAYSQAQERAEHPGRGKTRAIAAQELEAYDDRLQKALDDAAANDPAAYARYIQEGERIARGGIPQ